MSLRRAVPWVVLWFAGCTTTPVPDFRYYRLPPPSVGTVVERPSFELPVVVEAFKADGVLAERPILYSIDPAAVRLAQYNYQLWIEPPPVLVQRRWLEVLQRRGVAPLVTDKLSGRQPAFRLSGRIERFERLRVGDSTEIAVALTVRVDQDGLAAPRLERRYEERRTVEGAELKDSVAAIGAALDAILERWLEDWAQVSETFDVQRPPA
jgi:ABC-type uncharacterized transport system auxiliary subunit